MGRSWLDDVAGYHEATARESVGRDGAYLRQPRQVAGVILRPLTLRDYLRLSAEHSPFVRGGEANKDDACFLLWHQRAAIAAGDDPKTFAPQFDAVDVDLLAAACGQYVDEFMVDAPTGGGKRGAYYSLGASTIHTLRREYKCSQDEVLNTPMDELFQALRVIQHERGGVLFNRSDRLKGEHLARLSRKRGRSPKKPTEAWKRRQK